MIDECVVRLFFELKKDELRNEIVSSLDLTDCSIYFFGYAHCQSSITNNKKDSIAILIVVNSSEPTSLYPMVFNENYVTSEVAKYNRKEKLREIYGD